MKKIIIVLICFCGTYANAQPFIIDQIVGIVGNKPIRQSDVESLYLSFRMQGFPMQGDMKCNMFEHLLTQKLLMNQAEVDSLIVDISQVEMELNRRLDHFINNIVGSQERLEEHFNKSILEIREDLRQDIYDEMLAGMMRQEITANVRMTPSEVRSFYDRIPRDEVPLINGQAQVAQIVLHPPYSDEAINEVRQELLEMRRRVISGERFSVLARMFSECPSAMQGGELGFMSRGQLDPEFARAAWALREVGEVSRIVESKMGFHIIQLEGRRGDQVNVRHILMTPKVNPEATATAIERLDSITRMVRNDDINLSWNEAARFFSHDERTRFNGGLMINPHTFSTRFEMDHFERVDFNVIQHLNVGEISAPFQSRDENNRIVYKIVKLVDRSDPRRASLSTDFNFLSEMALHEKMDRIIQEWVEEKIESSYIFVDQSFRRCDMNNNWLR